MNQISFDDLFTDDVKEEIKEVVVETISSLSLSPLQEDIYLLLKSGETSGMAICEKLIEAGKLPTGRFSTNKPKAFPVVCAMLEELVKQGEILFIEDKEKLDRIYKLSALEKV